MTNPNKPSKKKSIVKLLKEGRSDSEIASQTGTSQNYINKVRTQQKKQPITKGDTTSQKKTSTIKTVQQPASKVSSPPPEPVQDDGQKKDLFTMSLEDAEALYASPAEVMALILHTKNIPEDRVKCQGKRLFNFLQKHQINIPYVEIVLLMAGAAADYGTIIKDYMAEQNKKKMLALPKPPPVKVKEVTPEQYKKKSDPIASKLIDKIPVKPAPLDLQPAKPKMTIAEVAAANEKKSGTVNLAGINKKPEAPKI